MGVVLPAKNLVVPREETGLNYPAGLPVHDDLVQREFTAEQANQLSMGVIDGS
jgi:hypothetical protein